MTKILQRFFILVDHWLFFLGADIKVNIAYQVGLETLKSFRFINEFRQNHFKNMGVELLKGPLHEKRRNIFNPNVLEEHDWENHCTLSHQNTRQRNKADQEFHV